MFLVRVWEEMGGGEGGGGAVEGACMSTTLFITLFMFLVVIASLTICQCERENQQRSGDEIWKLIYKNAY